MPAPTTAAPTAAYPAVRVHLREGAGGSGAVSTAAACGAGGGVTGATSGAMGTTGAGGGVVEATLGAAIVTAGASSTSTGNGRTDSRAPSFTRRTCTPTGTSRFSPGARGTPSSCSAIPSPPCTTASPVQPVGTNSLHTSASAHAVASAASLETSRRLAFCTILRALTSTSLILRARAAYVATTT